MSAMRSPGAGNSNHECAAVYTSAPAALHSDSRNKKLPESRQFFVWISNGLNLKLKHWRAFPGKNASKPAPMLDFANRSIIDPDVRVLHHLAPFGDFRTDESGKFLRR